MPQPQENNTLKELAMIKAQASAQAAGKPVEELPVGDDPVVEPVVEAAAPVEGEEVIPAVEPVKEKIKIGDQEFETQAEAIAYAEKLQYDKLVADAYNQGIRDTMQTQAPVAPAAEPVEDNFDEEFYTNPKGTLEKVKQQAKAEVLSEIQQSAERERLWDSFFTKYPDLAGDRALCEFVMQQNWDVIGKVTDLDKGMQLLAQKTRAVFQGYQERNKPKTELPRAPAAQVVSSGGGAAPSVTPKKDVAAPTNFAAELKSMRKR